MHDSFGIQNPRLLFPLYLFASLQGALQRRRMSTGAELVVWFSWFFPLPFQA
jgi:hypothetical protein